MNEPFGNILKITRNLTRKLKCFTLSKASIGCCNYICLQQLRRKKKLLCYHFTLCAGDLQTTIRVHLPVGILHWHRLALAYKCNFHFSKFQGKYPQLFKHKLSFNLNSHQPWYKEVNKLTSAPS